MKIPKEACETCKILPCKGKGCTDKPKSPDQKDLPICAEGQTCGGECMGSDCVYIVPNDCKGYCPENPVC